MKTGLIELHLHLDGSLDLPWAYDVALKRGAIEPNSTFEDFYRILYKRDFTYRAEIFKKFELTCDCMQTREDLHDSTYLLVKHLHELGLIYAEIRFASQQHCLKGLSQYEVMEAVLSGLNDAAKDYPDVLCKIINCMMHKGDSALFNDKENRETIEVTKAFLGKGVVGIDLAGFENNCDFKEYGYLYDIIHEYGIPSTLHAAEMGIGNHINEALDMKPNRIGHGINCVQDPAWLQRVVNEQIPLEVCVTSNCGHNLLYVEHPIRQLLDAGVKVTLNSDNMMFSNTDIDHEHEMLRRIGVTNKQLVQTTFNAIDAAFCTDEEKEMLRKRATEIYSAQNLL